MLFWICALGYMAPWTFVGSAAPRGVFRDRGRSRRAGYAARARVYAARAGVYAARRSRRARLSGSRRGRRVRRRRDRGRVSENAAAAAVPTPHSNASRRTPSRRGRPRSGPAVATARALDVGRVPQVADRVLQGAEERELLRAAPAFFSRGGGRSDARARQALARRPGAPQVELYGVYYALGLPVSLLSQRYDGYWDMKLTSPRTYRDRSGSPARCSVLQEGATSRPTRVFVSPSSSAGTSRAASSAFSRCSRRCS